MATNIAITITNDGKGNITVSWTDPTDVPKNTGVTWTVSGGSITNITQGSAFTGTPSKDAHGNWSATDVSAEGQKDYSFTVDPGGTFPTAGSTKNGRTPHISVKPGK
jgi:hypothetical protein